MKNSIKKICKSVISIMLVFAFCVDIIPQMVSAQEQVTIKYSIWDANQAEGMEAIIESFENENPDIKVELQVSGWDQFWTQLEASAGTNSMPDVFWMHPSQVLRFGQEDNILYDFSELLGSSEKVSKDVFVPEILELFTQNEKVLGIPKDYDTIALWYNKKIFDEAGMDYPNEEWTWDDLVTAAKELTDTEKGIYGFLAPQHGQPGYYNIIYSNGGYIVSEDYTESGYKLEETQKAVQDWANLGIEGISPSQADFAELDVNQYFQSGKAAMSYFGSWSTSAMAKNEFTNENTDLTVLPSGTKGKISVISGLSNSVNANSKNLDAAIKFAEYLGSEEAMSIQGKYGSAIPARIGSDNTYLEAFPQFNVKAYLDQVENAKTQPQHISSARRESIENEFLVQVFGGQKRIEEISDELVKSVEAVLAEDLKE